MGGHGAIEVAKTVIEVAEVEWTAIESHHHLHNNSHLSRNQEETNSSTPDNELESIRQTGESAPEELLIM